MEGWVTPEGSQIFLQENLNVTNPNTLVRSTVPVDTEMTGAPRSIVFKTPPLPTEMGQPATV